MFFSRELFCLLLYVCDEHVACVSASACQCSLFECVDCTRKPTFALEHMLLCRSIAQKCMNNA